MPVPDMRNGGEKDFNFGEAKSQLVKLVVVDKCDIIYNKVHIFNSLTYVYLPNMPM